MATSECVKVIVRCRPMNEREYSLNCNCVLQMDAARAQCIITNPNDKKAPPKHFTFDGAYFTDSTTEAIYNEIAYPLVEGVTEGYNGTIFAYGQTGCGKSFTMQGITDPPSQRGIIPRAFDHVFETVSVAEETKFLIHASYCEIYNEEIRDLLGKDVKEKLELHEHPERGVYVNGLSGHPVHNVVECEKIMQKGWKNRATGATLMNADSSRSHSIFTINLEMMTADDAGEEHIRAGKMNLVDLAGSERQAKTGATGARLKEATKINLSLSALGNVISALVDGKSKHIPYRDSKLTRLLQDSLGGNTKTLMVACLSPADNNYDETLSTLRYANRAKNIQNKPKINEDPKDALLRQYQEEIMKLKAMLMGQLPIPEGGFQDVGGAQAPKQKSDNQIAREELEFEKQRIREEYDNRLKDMQRQYEEEKVSKARLQQDMQKLRAFYDEKLTSVEGELEKIPTTAEVLGEEASSEAVDRDDQEKGDVKEGKKKKDTKGMVVGAATAGAAIMRNADGTPMRDAEGKIMTKSDAKAASKSDMVEVDKNGEPIERPSSVAGQDLPRGPEEKYYMDADGNIYSEQELASTQEGLSPGEDAEPVPAPASVVPAVAASQTPVQAPGLDKEVTFVNGEMHLQSDLSMGEVIVRPMLGPAQDGLAPVEGKKTDEEGLAAPRSSPTHAPMQEQLKFQQEEALKRLHELEQQMVGGEQIDNREMKERRKKRKTFAEERKRKLAEAIAKMDDDGIMLQIYDNIGDELKAKNKLLEKEKEKCEEAQREVLDLQSEFEFERIDYLDAIRKQERQLMLMQDLIDRISPCIRKDCNYSNIDRIKMECKFDEEEGKWILPKLTIERTALPVSGTILPGAGGSRSPRMSNGDLSEEYDDRFREKLMRKQDRSGQYFQTKRPSQLIQSSEPLSKVNMAEVKQSYNIQSANKALLTTNGVHGNMRDEPISSGLKAAQVHGQIMNDEGMVRKPMRLEALPSVGKKSKKKKNNYDGM